MFDDTNNLRRTSAPVPNKVFGELCDRKPARGTLTAARLQRNTPTQQPDPKPLRLADLRIRLQALVNYAGRK